MHRSTRACWLMGLALVLAVSARTSMTAQERDAGGFPAPTASLERGRAVYVLNHCHFCHGVDLTRSVMGATNLTQSRMLGADVDGKVIGGVIRAGLPNLQTAMPAYRDLTPEQIVELARYIHYLRQQVKYRELLSPAAAPPGDAAAGRALFEKAGTGTCASCHSVSGDLAGIARKYDAPTLRARLLRPGPVAPADGATLVPGHAAHLRLLENLTLADVENLLALLRESK